MIERSCIHPFIEQTQKNLSKGGSLNDALRQIRIYQERFNNLVTNISPEAKIPHMIGMSAVGLGTIVVWEYLRAHGVHLPDSKEVVAFLPVASVTEEDLTEEQREWATSSRNRRETNEQSRRRQDEHRKGARRWADDMVENGYFTPKERDKYNKDWDKRHGY